MGIENLFNIEDSDVLPTIDKWVETGDPMLLDDKVRYNFQELSAKSVVACWSGALNSDIPKSVRELMRWATADNEDIF